MTRRRRPTPSMKPMLSGQRGERYRTSHRSKSANGSSSKPIEKPVRKLKATAPPTTDQAQNHRHPRPSPPDRPRDRHRITATKPSAIGKTRIIVFHIVVRERPESPRDRPCERVARVTFRNTGPDETAATRLVVPPT